MRRNILLLIIAALSFSSLSAQKLARKIEIKGKVMDTYNSPIVNAIIMLDDQKTNSVTDRNGNYTVKVRRGTNKIGVFSFGNGMVETDISGRREINFTFNTIAARQVSPNVRDAESGVNTGYGLVKKKNLTTDITRIDGYNAKYSTYSSLSEMIKREVSGVVVNGNVVTIQGAWDYYGDVHPLIVLDGVYMNELPEIPPVTVSSIEVLKGTSAAIYGSRAFGGAIIIKTKLH